MRDANYLVDVKISVLHSVRKFDRNDFLPGRCFPRREPESRAKTIWIKQFPRWMYRRLYKYARANTCSGFCRRATRSELNTPSAKGNTCSCFCCSTAAFRSIAPFGGLFVFFVSLPSVGPANLFLNCLFHWTMWARLGSFQLDPSRF